MTPLLVNKKTLLQLLGVSRSTFHRRFLHAPGFPAPAVQNGRLRLWSLSDVQKWVDSLNHDPTA